MQTGGWKIFGIGLVSSEVVRQVVERIGIRKSVAAKGRAVPISDELDSVLFVTVN